MNAMGVEVPRMIRSSTTQDPGDSSFDNQTLSQRSLEDTTLPILERGSFNHPKKRSPAELPGTDRNLFEKQNATLFSMRMEKVPSNIVYQMLVFLMVMNPMMVESVKKKHTKKKTQILHSWEPTVTYPFPKALLSR